MPFLFAYFLKLSISLAMVCLFYQLVLRKLTFYNWNRWYLLGYSLLSFVIALVNITPSLEKTELANNEMIRLIPAIGINDAEQPIDHSLLTASLHWNASDWFLLFLFTGMGLLLIRLCILYLSFLRVRRQASLISDGNMKIYQVDKDIIPFSFGNSIFINRQLHDEAELQEIIRHEFIHVKQKHTHDIIISEMICILNWYNPFAWMIRKAIRQNLEFIADNKVVENGFDKKTYQYLLLKVIGNNHFSIANQFNFSSLKKRIVMMNKMKSARLHLVRFLFILPLIAIMLLAFRNKRNEKGPVTHVSNGSISLMKEVRDTPPPPPPPPPVPPPPPDPTPPKLPADVKSIDVNDGHIVVTLKNGKKEKYDLSKEEDNESFQKKYGHLEIAPPVPEVEETPETPAAPKAVTVTASVATSPVVKVDAKATTVTSNDLSFDVAPTAAAVTVGPIKATTTTDLSTRSSVRASTESNNTYEISNVSVSGSGSSARPARPSPAGEKVLEMKIYKSSGKDKLDKFIADAKAKGAELVFNTIEYNSKNELVKLAGKMKTDQSTNTFSATDFESVTLVLIKNKVGYSCYIVVNDQREEM